MFALLGLALLLGLRHALDPDHLAAVSTLVAIDDDGKRARRLGLAWGLGHATSLAILGAPVVLFGSFLPDPVQVGAEAVVGVVIVALGVRLLVRFRRGEFRVHAHGHAHPGTYHRHAHRHEPDPEHGTFHHAGLRTERQAFGVGIVHGTGGSAAASLLALSLASSTTAALAALAVFAAGTALSMTVLSTLLGAALARSGVLRRLPGLTPALGVGAAAFGAYYSLGALGLL